MRRACEIGVLRGHQRRDELPFALAQQGGQHQGQQDGREGQLQVDDAHDQRLDAATDKTGQRAQRGTERERNHARDQPDLQRDTQPVQDGRIQVAPLRVGAKQMGETAAAKIARRAPRVGQHQFCQVVGVLRRDQRRGESQQDDQAQQRCGHNRHPAFAELLQEHPPRAGERCRAGCCAAHKLRAVRRGVERLRHGRAARGDAHGVRHVVLRARRRGSSAT